MPKNDTQTTTTAVDAARRELADAKAKTEAARLEMKRAAQSYRGSQTKPEGEDGIAWFRARVAHREAQDREAQAAHRLARIEHAAEVDAGRLEAVAADPARIVEDVHEDLAEAAELERQAAALRQRAAARVDAAKVAHASLTAERAAAGKGGPPPLPVVGYATPPPQMVGIELAPDRGPKMHTSTIDGWQAAIDEELVRIQEAHEDAVERRRQRDEARAAAEADRRKDEERRRAQIRESIERGRAEHEERTGRRRGLLDRARARLGVV